VTNLLRLIEGRSGERLIQALILHAVGEERFRSEFVEWLGFDELGACTRVREEVKDQTRRYDLVLDFGKGVKRNIELKLHATFTDEQDADLSAKKVGFFHAVLVPEYRFDEVNKRYGKEGLVIRTWEEFAQGPARSTSTALVLFDQMLEYVHGVEYLTVDQVKKGIQLWVKKKKGYWTNEWGLFHRFLVRLRYETKQRYPNLTVGPVKAAPKSRFYGFLVRPKNMKGMIWFGLVAIPAEDWIGLYVQAHEQVQDILNLPSVTSDDRWWSVSEAEMGNNAECIPPDSHERYVLNKVQRALWKHVNKLDKEGRKT
jgi:hypothetical protein